jgi:hypothetical protein
MLLIRTEQLNNPLSPTTSFHLPEYVSLVASDCDPGSYVGVVETLTTELMGKTRLVPFDEVSGDVIASA